MPAILCHHDYVMTPSDLSYWYLPQSLGEGGRGRGLALWLARIVHILILHCDVRGKGGGRKRAVAERKQHALSNEK